MYVVTCKFIIKMNFPATSCCNVNECVLYYFISFRDNTNLWMVGLGNHLQANSSQCSYLPETRIPLYLSGCGRPCWNHLCFPQGWWRSCGRGDLNHKIFFFFFRSITCLNIWRCFGGSRSNPTFNSNILFQLDLSCMGIFKAFSIYLQLMLRWTHLCQGKSLSITTCPSINFNGVSWFLIKGQWIYLFLSFGYCWKLQRTLFVHTQISRGENWKVHVRPVVTVIS